MRNIQRTLTIVLTLLAFTFGSIGVTPARAATTWTVTSLTDTVTANAANCPHASNCGLRDAIEAASSGDTIIFDSGLSGGTIYLEATLIIAKNITIDGSTLASKITISGDTDNNGVGDLRVFEFNSATATLDSLIITKGSVDNGAGIYNLFGSVTIKNSEILGNQSNYDGGGIINDTGSTLVINNSTISENAAGYGGAISNSGTLTVINSTFSGNLSMYGGSGIGNSSVLNIYNSTFSGNYDSGFSGAIINSGTLNFSNTIIANSYGADCINTGSIGINTNNLVQDGSCSALLSGNPKIAAIADNGGTTQTMALIAGSPAIDAGDDTVCAASPVNGQDQRGVSRPTGSHCDIGAYEGSAPEAPAPTIRVSVASDNTEANNHSGLVSISGDGRFTSFYSSASNLVGSDSNGFDDVFVHDGQTNTTSIVSVASDGTQGDGDSQSSAISSDGRYVAFYSWASNLVNNDVNGLDDIFMRDTQTNTTTIISIASDGTQSNGDSGFPVVSSDGRYVAFASTADSLVSGDTNSQYDVFLRDTQTNTTTRVSVANDGAEGNNESGMYGLSMSSDGRYITFASSADNLVSGDTNAQVDIFVRDTQANTTIRVSTNSNGAQANQRCSSPVISANGRYVAFESQATNLVAGDTNGHGDIFMRDTQTNITTRISVASNGSQVNGDSWNSSISGDGRYVAFSSDATNLSAGDSNGTTDVFLRDTQANATTRKSITFDDAEANDASNSLSLSLSADGKYLAFSSTATNLINGDINGKSDAFVRDLSASAGDDTTPPIVNTFTVPSTSTGLNISITAFSALDNVAVTGYKITTSATPPLASDAGWSSTAPASFAVSTLGNYTLYSWAKDAAGNVSAAFITPRNVTTSSPIERAKNGGFNTYADTSMIPRNWVKSSNFAPTDGKDTTVKNEGTASVQITGQTGKTKTLTQTLYLSGAGGDVFTFSFWSKGFAIPTGDICKAEVILYNASTVISTKSIACATNSVFAKKSFSLTASGAYDKVVIKFTYSKPSGTIWLDKVSLTK